MAGYGRRRSGAAAAQHATAAEGANDERCWSGSGGSPASIGVAGLRRWRAIARVTGHYTVGSFQVGTLLLAGIASMVAGCLALLWAITSRDDGSR